ncbi:MAG: methyltransferase domain-containing protein, partial [Gammaproteobacteria bacterium]|nr:methyltransferase domain-containing protein [Gammaproteobacteria bacterium]
MRADLAIIAEWIKPGSSILDLGCGDGTLLKCLREHQQVRGIGLEIDEHNIETCLSNNLNIIQSDLNNGLQDYFSDNSFD